MSKTPDPTTSTRRHHLKTWPGPFRDIKAGRKTFEYRRDDRGYEEGDELLLWCARHVLPASLCGAISMANSESQPTMRKTQRGFDRMEFADRNGVSCSLQKSSLAFEDCIWLGANEIGLKRFAPGAGGWSAFRWSRMRHMA